MTNKSLHCLIIVLGSTCFNTAVISDERLSNTTYLSAHEVKKVSIGRSFSNCQSTKVSQRYMGLKTCASANVSDIYYMAAGFFHNSMTQLFSERTARGIKRAGLKFSIGYKERKTRLGLRVRF